MQGDWGGVGGEAVLVAQGVVQEQSSTTERTRRRGSLCLPEASPESVSGAVVSIANIVHFPRPPCLSCSPRDELAPVRLRSVPHFTR